MLIKKILIFHFYLILVCKSSTFSYMSTVFDFPESPIFFQQFDTLSQNLGFHPLFDFSSTIPFLINFSVFSPKHQPEYFFYQYSNSFVFFHQFLRVFGDFLLINQPYFLQSSPSRIFKVFSIIAIIILIIYLHAYQGLYSKKGMIMTQSPNLITRSCHLICHTTLVSKLLMKF